MKMGGEGDTILYGVVLEDLKGKENFISAQIGHLSVHTIPTAGL